MMRTLILAALLTLSACGGGYSDPDAGCAALVETAQALGCEPGVNTEPACVAGRAWYRCQPGVGTGLWIVTNEPCTAGPDGYPMIDLNTCPGTVEVRWDGAVR